VFGTNLFGTRVSSSQPVESPGSHEYGRGTKITIAPAKSIIDIEGVRALFPRYGESLSFCLAFQGFEAELAGLPAPYVPPHGSLLVAKSGLDYLGVVGLKRLSVGKAEIKRLYVVLEARGCGSAFRDSYSPGSSPLAPPNASRFGKHGTALFGSTDHNAGRNIRLRPPPSINFFATALRHALFEPPDVRRRLRSAMPARSDD
jgi:hypothetical protein